MARARNKKEEVKTEEIDQAADLAAIEAALNGEGDVNLDDLDTALDAEGAVAADESKMDDIDEGELMNALSADEAREAAYEGVESKIDINEVEEVKPEAVEPVGEEKKATKRDVVNDPAAFADAATAIFNGTDIVLDSEQGAISAEDFNTRMKAVSQKKVREKILGLLNAVMTGGTPSKYTQIAGDLLVKAYNDGCKPVTLAEIKKAYEDAGYKPGTVGAQSGQMMAMFPVLGVAKKPQNGILEPNPNSVILDILAG